MAYVVRYPAHFEEDARVIEAKGWLEGVVIEAGSHKHRPVFYDETRLRQAIADALASDGYLAERSIVVLPRVTRDHIEAAADRLSRSGFADIA